MTHGSGFCDDFSKVFDTVSTSLLLEKLDYFGKRGNVYGQIKSYLEERNSLLPLSVDTEVRSP